MLKKHLNVIEYSELDECSQNTFCQYVMILLPRAERDLRRVLSDLTYGYTTLEEYDTVQERCGSRVILPVTILHNALQLFPYDSEVSEYKQRMKELEEEINAYTGLVIH